MADVTGRAQFLISRISRRSLLACAGSALAGIPQTQATGLNLTFFLRRLRTLDHLPELAEAHTALSSTWDRTGGNADGTDFKRIEGGRNILLDVPGPGCIHRIFTGRLGAAVAGTRIQVFLDRRPQPLLDLPVESFFDDREGPFPYPFVFRKTYPGVLFPIPFAGHCLVQLTSSAAQPRWGNFWQVAYTTFPRNTPAVSLRWPLGVEESGELERARRVWLSAESSPPKPPERWTSELTFSLDPAGIREVPLAGCGVIRDLRVTVRPGTPDLLLGTRFSIYWDGAPDPSVDVPLGYLFGNGNYGDDLEARFSSLLLGLEAEGSKQSNRAYCRFPMPFAKGAVLKFHNRSGLRAGQIIVRLEIERRESLPQNWGRFHATWSERRAWEEDLPQFPKFGPRQAPAHVVLDRAARGKYVGALLYVKWPHAEWWGEGDWLIWTDEDGWPPSYHGTGSEEYFNSGWCDFDRKAVSGYIAKRRPGDVAVYSFHLNDAFQFQRRIRVAVEIRKWPGADRGIWGSTAFWYASPAQSSGSVVPE